MQEGLCDSDEEQCLLHQRGRSIDKMGGLEDIPEANLSGTCSRLAIGTDRERSAGVPLGFLAQAAARMDPRPLTSLRWRSTKRTRTGELLDVNTQHSFTRLRFLGLLSFLESNYSTANQLFITLSHRVINFKLEGISKIV